MQESKVSVSQPCSIYGQHTHSGPAGVGKEGEPGGETISSTETAKKGRNKPLTLLSNDQKVLVCNSKCSKEMRNLFKWQNWNA